MAKPNKDGWIRHRGGVPKDVPFGAVLMVRDRDGEIEKFHMSYSKIMWKHYGKDDPFGDTDIMAYKLLEDPLPPIGLP